MVTIVNYSERESRDGKKFYTLNLQGGMEMVLSEETGNFYATAKQASITSTFDEKTCQSLVGSKLPGKITRITCEPFDFTIKATGEIIKLNHRWVYDPNEKSLEEVVFEKELSPEGLVL